MRRELKSRADEARMMYKAGKISRAEAKEAIMPYIEAFNAFSRQTAEKYGLRKPKLISFAGFAR